MKRLLYVLCVPLFWRADSIVVVGSAVDVFVVIAHVESSDFIALCLTMETATTTTT